MQGAGTPLLAIHRRNGGAHPCREGWSMGLRGARRLPSSWGVGEQERSLTGDATAIRCADAFHPRRNLHRRSRAAWGDGCASSERDATGERSVSLAKMCETENAVCSYAHILQSALDACFTYAESIEPTRCYWPAIHPCSLSAIAGMKDTPLSRGMSCSAKLNHQGRSF